MGIRRLSFILAALTVSGFALGAWRAFPDGAPYPSDVDLVLPGFSFSLPPRSQLRERRSRPMGLVVPHHLPAAELMARAFASIDPTAYERIVLISPDHFAQGRGSVHLAALNVRTVYGDVRAAPVPQPLADLPQFTATQLSREHGLSLHLPFLARYFPGVPVLPLAVRAEAPLEVLAEIARAIARPGTLVVVSLDFSHEQSSVWAQYHDAAAIAALAAADPHGLDHLEIDVHAPLQLFLLAMRHAGSQRFALFANENIQTINPAGRYAQVTSYVTGAYSRGQPKPQAGVSLTFTPQVDGGVGDLERQVPRLLQGDDASIAVPVVGVERVARGQVDAVVVAVSARGVGDERLIVEQFFRVRPSEGFTVAQVDWGASGTIVSERQRRLARALVEAGADLIVGSGSSVIQSVEVYRGRAIFYSLGSGAAGHGLAAALGVRLQLGQVQYYVQPLIAVGSALRQANANQGRQVFDALVPASADELLAPLRSGRLTLGIE